MRAEVVALGLEHVRGQVLGAHAVEERQGGRERRGRDTPQRALGDDVAPAGLRLVDGLVEEVVEQQVLEVGVLAVAERSQFTVLEAVVSSMLTPW